jgi:hypothetical protein
MAEEEKGAKDDFNMSSDESSNSKNVKPNIGDEQKFFKE